MKKKIIIGSIILVVIIVGIIFVTLNNKDEAKFKQDYESLNGTTRKEDGAIYHNVDIPKDNRMKYVDAKEATKLIKEGTGILYLGANWCPWCRNAAPVLIEAAQNQNLKTIYYLDMDKVRNIWEVKNNKLIKTQKEQDGYYDLLKALDSVLEKETYKITDKDKEYDTKEKRIYMPSVVSFKEGKILDMHVGTVELDKDQTKYSTLTKKQEKELLKIYEDMIKKTMSKQCTSDGKC